jgi:hypothetical protein
MNNKDLETMLVLNYAPEHLTAVDVMEFLCETDQLNEKTANILVKIMDRIEDSSCFIATYAQIVEIAEADKPKIFDIILNNRAFAALMRKHEGSLLQYLENNKS